MSISVRIPAPVIGVYRRLEAPGLVEASTAGYSQVLESDRLFQLAVENDVVVHVLRHAGEFATRGLPLCQVWPAAKLTQELADALRGAYAVGAQRTAEKDPLVGMELLAEVAVRALSPGINDPNTAVNCLHYLGDLLVRVAGHELPRQVLRDERSLRVVIATPDFRDFLERSVLAIAGAGAGHVLVVVTLLGVLRDMASVTHDRARRQLIGKMVQAIAELALKQLSFEREQVQDAMGRLSFDESDVPGNVSLPRQRRKT